MSTTNLPEGRRIGRYTVLQVLGHGGMGDVYHARDEELGRDVALKLPHPEALGDVVTYERFSREVKIGQLLDHPNIQKLYELGGDNSEPYLVLEYVPGQSLRQMLCDNRQAGGETHHAVATALTIGIQIGRALTYAHELHVFHRDMKPENVIITPDGQVKVMDFGIAFLKGARRITWGPLSAQVGTPDYMAPEQIKGARGDARTDIYAVGMMLYECVAGRPPYDGDNALAIMNQHVNLSPPPLSRFCHDVPPPLEAVIMKAIRRQPEGRWASMRAMVEALENLDRVDVAALQAEREQDDEHPRSSRRVFGLAVWQAALLAVAALAALALAVLVPHPW